MATTVRHPSSSASSAWVASTSRYAAAPSGIDGVRLDEDEYTYRDPDTGENEPTEPDGGQSAWDVPVGAVFVLGDHRQESTDSRFDSVGFVDNDDVVGRAWLRFFPVDGLGILPTPTYPETQSAGSPTTEDAAASQLPAE